MGEHDFHRWRADNGLDAMQDQLVVQYMRHFTTLFDENEIGSEEICLVLYVRMRSVVITGLSV